MPNLGSRPGSRPPPERPSHIRHCSGSHNNVAHLGATTDAAQGVCSARCGAYDHSASTRILPAFTAASRRSFLSCGANALRSLS